MDKRLILAVAGSGKTTYLVNKLDLHRRVLIVTYTVNNTRNLHRKIIEKFGYFPDNITLFSYFSFLYSFCFRPFLLDEIKPKGIYWKIPPFWTNKIQRSDIKYYMHKDGRLYHNRIAKLLETYEVISDIKDRIYKYFDELFIDEIQDFAGHDFNLLRRITEIDKDMLFVGDFFQHTFDTSRDGNVNKNLHNSYSDYKNKFTGIGFDVDTDCLDKSYRCSPSICNFISDNLGIDISSHKAEDSKVHMINNAKDAVDVFKNDKIIKLFYKEHYKYSCYSRNWGDSKGENHYEDVCVVLNKTSMEKFDENKLYDLKPTTKNKLYVACSRANGNLYIVSDKLLKKYKE